MPSEQDVYKQAVQFYQAGDLPKTEQALRQILGSNARHAPSLHLMGIIALDLQNYEVAEGFVSAALTAQNNNPSFYLTMGRILNRQDKKEDAIEYYKMAIALKPDFTDALNNLGTIFLSLKKMEEASDIFEKILKNNPRDVNALCNMASILYQQDKYQESLSYALKALAIDPDRPEIKYDTAIALVELNKPDKALPLLLEFMAQRPDHVDALLKTGNIYRKKGNFDEALSLYSRVLALEENELAHVGIATTYIEQKRHEEALLFTESASKKFPNSARLSNFLGSIYDRFSMYHEALACYDRAIEIDPMIADTYSNKANTLKQLGHLDQAIETQRKAISIAPLSWIYSNILLTMLYASSVTPEDIAETAREFGNKVADHLQRNRPFTNDKNPDRKLRIGYVSPDFRNHAVRYFLSPIYLQDKENFEIFAYSKTEYEDAITEKLKQHFDHWRDIRELTPDEAADLIEQDKVDILVDLAGHTANNGLMIFARKPAPVQVTWLGYPATTGMKAMDYKITDGNLDPEGMTESLHTEKLWRLPDIFCAYTPHEKSPSVIDHPPFEDNGYITFGCFNNFSKVTDTVLQTWARIIKQAPNSKLMLEISGIEDDKIRTDIEKRIAECGIPKDRLILEANRKENQFVLYNKIDIALDPFPAVGGTTSMDTLWMGVPFVTLAGKHFMSRMGITILKNAGLPELIAQNLDEYVALAVDLATDQEKLRATRHNLRERVAASPVMDQKRFARSMEDAYRQMWRIWTATTQ